MTESKKLRKVVEEFGEKFKKYAGKYSELDRQKEGLEKELEEVKRKMDDLKEPDWVKGMIEPIAKEMLKRLPGMEYDYWQPHGDDRILTVYFYPKGKKTAEEVLTGKETLAISFVAGDLTKGELMMKDFKKDSGVFKKGSNEYFNGWNYPNVPVKLDVDWLVEWLKNQRVSKGNSQDKRSVKITENDLVLVSQVLESVEDKSKEENKAIAKIMDFALTHVSDEKKVGE